jgi:hypothetical protein
LLNQFEELVRAYKWNDTFLSFFFWKEVAKKNPTTTSSYL